MKKIILLRHGEVEFRSNKSVVASELKQLIEKYSSNDIKADFPSKNEIKNLLSQADILVCSSLKRSLQSVAIFDMTPNESNTLFDEAEIPYANWNLLKLKPKIWLVVFRVLWFFGYSKNSESYKETKQRAKKAASRLIELSQENKTVILIGHGIMNKLIQRELKLQSWDETKKLKSVNWGYGVFLQYNSNQLG